MTICRWLSRGLIAVLVSGLFAAGDANRTATAGPPNNYEQYLIELVNRDRADPVAAASRYGIDLNEGLAPNTIAPGARQPLAINPALTGAAHDYVEYLRANGLFSHYGPGTLSPGDRMTAAGYATAGTFNWGENLAYYAGPPFSVSLIETLNKQLFVDAGVAGRGHRLAILNNNYTEVGPGVAIGSYKPPGGSLYSSAVLVGQDFGNKFDGPYLTGVAYNDFSGNNFYEPGEGLGSVTIVATRQSNGQQYAVTTWSSGGYSLKLPTGVYDVAAFGSALGGTVFDRNVTVGSLNFKDDFLTSELLKTGDATADDIVDIADYTVWADNFLDPNLYHNGSTGDFSGNGVVDIADYTIWADRFAPATLAAVAVPEPRSLVLTLIAGASGLLGLLVRRLRERSM